MHPKTQIQKYKKYYKLVISTITEKTAIEIIAIKKLLVKAASIIAIDTSRADKWCIEHINNVSLNFSYH